MVLPEVDPKASPATLASGVKRCLKSREVRGPRQHVEANVHSFQPVSGFPTGNILEIASQPLNPGRYGYNDQG